MRKLLIFLIVAFFAIESQSQPLEYYREGFARHYKVVIEQDTLLYLKNFIVEKQDNIVCLITDSITYEFNNFIIHLDRYYSYNGHQDDKTAKTYRKRFSLESDTSFLVNHSCFVKAKRKGMAEPSIFYAGLLLNQALLNLDQKSVSNLNFRIGNNLKFNTFLPGFSIDAWLGYSQRFGARGNIALRINGSNFIPWIGYSDRLIAIHKSGFNSVISQIEDNYLENNAMKVISANAVGFDVQYSSKGLIRFGALSETINKIIPEYNLAVKHYFNSMGVVALSYFYSQADSYYGLGFSLSDSDEENKIMLRYLDAKVQITGHVGSLDDVALLCMDIFLDTKKVKQTNAAVLDDYGSLSIGVYSNVDNLYNISRIFGYNIKTIFGLSYEYNFGQRILKFNILSFIN